MKISQICALAVLLAVGSAMAFADGVNDPKIIIHGASSEDLIQGSCSQCVGVGMNFSFSVPASGSGSLFFTNKSGQNWTSLALIEQGHTVPAADIKCSSYLFMSCTAETLKNGNVEILLAGVKSRADWRDLGIPNGASFSIQFSCLKSNCWPGGLSFSGHANAVPEPETVALMVTGLGAIVSRRKMWKRSLKA